MRVLGVTEKWPKLKKAEWTTFRFKRRDRDWEVGEEVQVVFKNRSKNREILGTARILAKEPRNMINAPNAPIYNYPVLKESEAMEDGFNSASEMLEWLFRQYGTARLNSEPMNRLTLRWTHKPSFTPAMGGMLLV
jgi:hypothetical protein